MVSKYQALIDAGLITATLEAIPPVVQWDIEILNTSSWPHEHDFWIYKSVDGTTVPTTTTYFPFGGASPAPLEEEAADSNLVIHQNLNGTPPASTGGSPSQTSGVGHIWTVPGDPDYTGSYVLATYDAWGDGWNTGRILVRSKYIADDGTVKSVERIETNGVRSGNGPLVEAIPAGTYFYEVPTLSHAFLKNVAQIMPLTEIVGEAKLYTFEVFKAFIGTEVKILQTSDYGNMGISDLLNLGYTYAELIAGGINVWELIGGDIGGEGTFDYSGGGLTSVSMSADGSIIAVGAWRNDGNGTDSGHVRVYQRDTSVALGWAKVGQDIDGEAATSDYSGHFGILIS